METTSQNLTTASGMLDAYLKTFSDAPAQTYDGKGISPEEFHRLIKSRPVGETVTACIARKQFDLAVVFLDSAYYRNQPGSQSDQELARLGMDLAEACLKEKKLNFVEWGLNRACEIYPKGSPERRQVIERGVNLVDEFTGAGGSMWFAQVILTRSLEIYPHGTTEHFLATEKLMKITQQLQASRKLGNRQNVVMSLAKPPRQSGFLGMAGVTS